MTTTTTGPWFPHTHTHVHETAYTYTFAHKKSRKWRRKTNNQTEMRSYIHEDHCLSVCLTLEVKAIKQTHLMSNVHTDNRKNLINFICDSTFSAFWMGSTILIYSSHRLPLCRLSRSISLQPLSLNTYKQILFFCYIYI